MQATNQDFPFYGTVSHGTMRNEDLIPCFADVLSLLVGSTSMYHDLLQEAASLKEFNTESAYWVVESLFDALNYLAPDGYYFGAHPGNGSDYGFWPVDCD